MPTTPGLPTRPRYTAADITQRSLTMADPVEGSGCYMPDPKYTFCFAKQGVACMICTESSLTLPRSQERTRDSNPSLLPCGHVFGHDCLKLWLQSHDTCPICRFRLRYELCSHRISPCRLTKENVLFVPQTIPDGGMVGLQCSQCWQDTDQRVASELLMPLTRKYYECKMAYEISRSGFDKHAMVLAEEDLNRMWEALSPPQEGRW
ncbi:hypothetical protein VTI74DRAFT_4767 [Chaetomium olivicolor]